jgi:hypothetical protein
MPTRSARPRRPGVADRRSRFIYTHVMPAQYREVANVLDAWLGDGQGGEDDGG